jgi:uncharacterized membrane protein
MIQRIQSLYLLIAFIVGVIVFNLSINIEFDEGIRQAYRDNYGFLIAPVLLLLSLFLFKKRSLQSLVVLIISIQQLLQIGLLLPSFDLSDDINFTEIAILLSFITVVLTWLARRGIRNDNALVRSVNRIR